MRMSEIPVYTTHINTFPYGKEYYGSFFNLERRDTAGNIVGNPHIPFEGRVYFTSTNIVHVDKFYFSNEHINYECTDLKYNHKQSKQSSIVVKLVSGLRNVDNNKINSSEIIRSIFYTPFGSSEPITDFELEIEPIEQVADRIRNMTFLSPGQIDAKLERIKNSCFVYSSGPYKEKSLGLFSFSVFLEKEHFDQLSQQAINKQINYIEISMQRLAGLYHNSSYYDNFEDKCELTFLSHDDKVMHNGEEYSGYVSRLDVVSDLYLTVINS